MAIKIKQKKKEKAQERQVMHMKRIARHQPPVPRHCPAERNPPFPQLYMLSMTPYGVEYPPAPCAPPACPLVGWCDLQKRPWLCVSTAQWQWKHSCVINTVYSTDPKQDPYQPTMKKINSTPAKTSTCVLVVFVSAVYITVLKYLLNKHLTDILLVLKL